MVVFLCNMLTLRGGTWELNEISSLSFERINLSVFKM